MKKPTNKPKVAGGKGDKRIAAQISDDQVQNNWDQIFGKKRFHGRSRSADENKS